MQPAPFGRVASLAFDSVSSMLGAVWLEWRHDVARMDFESEVDDYDAHGDLPQMRAITDYHVVASTGQLGRVEIKFSIDALPAEERLRLSQLADHAKLKGLTFELMDRVTLEQNGFIDTVLVLRPYSLMQWPASAVTAALKRLQPYPTGTLALWRHRAREVRVPVALTYQLLYRQKLPLCYEPLISVELDVCRA